MDIAKHTRSPRRGQALCWARDSGEPERRGSPESRCGPPWGPGLKHAHCPGASIISVDLPQKQTI